MEIISEERKKEKKKKYGKMEGERERVSEWVTIKMVKELVMETGKKIYTEELKLKERILIDDMKWFPFLKLREKKRKKRKKKKKHEECRKRILKKGIEGEIQTQEKLQYVKKKKHTKFKRKK